MAHGPEVEELRDEEEESDLAEHGRHTTGNAVELERTVNSSIGPAKGARVEEGCG